MQLNPIKIPVMAGLFRVAKILSHPRCLPSDGWVNKIWYICTVEYCSAVEKNEALSFATM